MRQQAALVEGSRDQPRHDGEPCAGEQQLHSVTITAPEPERAGRSSKNQPLEPGLSSACRKRRAELWRAPACGNWIQSPDRWTLNATALTNCRRNSKPLHPTDASRSAARFRERGALPRLSAGRSNDTLAGERRWSRGDRSRAAVRPPFSPPGSAADFPSKPAAPSADQAAPAAAASDWRLPETASRARHRVVQRGRVYRCTS